ncbi:MAG: AzlC family ABC transporter permease [Brooklawnia sp.]|jgi:predicted branched-subunit amino acid permease
MAARDAALGALRDSIPIALGYFTVSLAFGLYCAQAGVPTALAGLISATNLSSSGQFAGITIIAANGGYLELAIGVGLVNLRYVLMAISLGQRLDAGVGVGKRLVMAAGITDEIYALGMARRQVGFADYVASMVLPIIGWTAGTVVGAAAGEVLPLALTSAFGVLLYAMFVAIVVPVAQVSRKVLGVALGAAGLSSALALVEQLDVGWRIIIVTVVVSAIAATVAPHHPESGPAT